MTHIQQRRDTFANWTLANPVLMDGEAGHERDTGRWKLGDGATAYIDLPYKSGVDSVAGKIGAVSLEVADVGGAAPLASPALTGSPTAPTPNTTDNSTRVPTTAWVKSLGFAPLSSPHLTDQATSSYPVLADSSGRIATTQWVRDFVYAGNPVIDPDAALEISPPAADNSNRLATTSWVRGALGSSVKFDYYDAAPLPDGGGAFASVNTAARWARLGDLIHFTAQVQIISVGSGTGTLTIALPAPSASVPFAQMVMGRENQAIGEMLQGVINPSSTRFQVFNFGNAPIMASNRTVIISGSYEAAPLV